MVVFFEVYANSADLAISTRAEGEENMPPDTENRIDISELVRVGIALSSEKNLDQLLDLIVAEARKITNADGGSLYIFNEKKDTLQFAVIQNRKLNVWQKGIDRIISWPPIPLHDADGRENYRNVASACALQKKIINIPDVYKDRDFDFSGTRAFDRMNDYRSVSMLVVPMLDHEDEVIGVLQLINARALKTSNITLFLQSQQEIVRSLASQAAVAINNARFISDLEKLLHAFVEAIARAIDEKSPSTRGHITRVSELTDAMAREIAKIKTGPLEQVSFTAAQLDEIRLAALMHDIGKIVTPEHVIDKGTKLEGLSDRIEVVRLRVEVFKRDLRVQWLEKAWTAAQKNEPAPDGEELEQSLRQLDQDFEFIALLNGCILQVDAAAERRVAAFAAKTFRIKDTTQPLLYPDEVSNLFIRYGNLNQSERGIINQHVVMTGKMLEDVPFPRRFRNVPRFAVMHHEKLNGKGYPHGLSQDMIPLPARILAIADIFEALTAADRSYKNGKKLSEAVRILEEMAESGFLDKEVCDLFVTSGLVSEYACRYLDDVQRDAFSWGNKVYAAEPEVGEKGRNTVKPHGEDSAVF